MRDKSASCSPRSWRGTGGMSSVRALMLLATVICAGIAVAGVLGGPAKAASDAAIDVTEVPAPAEHLAAPQAGFRTVVIDPGHGGSEIGAVGPSGLTEKEITLDIANRLNDLLVGRLGLDVRMTRDRDVDRPLEQRTAFANNLKADLFISIHANSYRGRGVRGAETFFLSDRATDDDARRVAAIENNALGLQGPASSDDGLQMLLWDMAQTAHLQESAVLAEMIQSQLNSLGGTTDRGIKQAPFRVLKGADMPAVLVEVGFLSNPEEEQMLADPAYRQRIADMLFTSVSEYRRRQAMLLGGDPNR